MRMEPGMDMSEVLKLDVRRSEQVLCSPPKLGGLLSFILHKKAARP